MGGAAGGDEDAGADHAADAEADEVIPAEGLAHVVAGTGANPAHLLVGGGHRNGSASEPGRGVSEGA